MTIDYVDYSGPGSTHITDGNIIVPIESAAGAILFAGACVQSGIGDAQEAAEVQEQVDAALAAATATAR